MPDLGTSNPLALSATDFIKSGLRLVGALRSGLGLTNDELNDCKLVLNSMLDAFSIERTQIPATAIQTLDQNQNALSLVGGQASYKLGNANGNGRFSLAAAVAGGARLHPVLGLAADSGRIADGDGR